MLSVDRRTPISGPSSEPLIRRSAREVRCLSFNSPRASVLLHRTVDLNYRYDKASSYRAGDFQFALTDDGAYSLAHELVLSRYIGLVELSDDEDPLLDVLLDSTDTVTNPSVLACVLRRRLDADAALCNLYRRLAASYIFQVTASANRLPFPSDRSRQALRFLVEGQPLGSRKFRHVVLDDGYRSFDGTLEMTCLLKRNRL